MFNGNLEEFDKWIDGIKGDEAAKRSSMARQEQRGFLSEAASALGAGVVSTGESIAGAGEMLGIPGAGAAREYLQEVGEGEALRRPDYLAEGTIVEHPERLADWRWWTRSLGENLPNMAAMMLPGLGVMKGAQAYVKATGLAKGLVEATEAGMAITSAGRKLIRTASLAGAWGGAATIEAGSAYSQAKKEMDELGYDDQTIERVATAEALAIGVTNGILEVLPFDNLVFKTTGADKIIKRLVKQAFLEGSTETAQEAVSILSERMGHVPEIETGNAIGRMLESGIIGGVLGGGAGAVFSGETEKAAEKDRQDKITSEQPVTTTGLEKTAVAAKPILEAVTERREDAARKEKARADATALVDTLLQEEEASREEIERQAQSSKLKAEEGLEAGRLGGEKAGPIVEEVQGEEAPEGRMARVLGEEAPGDGEEASPGGAVSERVAGERAIEAGGGSEGGEEVGEAKPVVRGPLTVARLTDPGTLNTERPVHDYASTQVDLPEETATAVRTYAGTIPEKSLFHDPKDPSVSGREDDPHVTVKYGLHTDNSEDVRKVLEGQGPITVKLGKTKVFEQDDHDVLVAEVESPELHTLNKKLSDNLEHTDTYPTYQPHVTIAYLKKGEGRKYAGDASFEGKEVTLDAVTYAGKDESKVVIPLTGEAETKATVKEKEIPKGVASITGKKPSGQAAEKEPQAPTKEPWEMTREEWRKVGDNGMGKRYLRYPSTKTERLLNHGVDALHEMIVEQALADGKPVPDEVLTDYPRLAAKKEEEKPKPGAGVTSITGKKATEKAVEGKPSPAHEVKKEPWEMSAQEWLDGTRFYYSGGTKNAQLPSGERVILIKGVTPGNFREKSREFLLRSHKGIVTKALSEGKSVPPEVLKDYPELAKNPVGETAKEREARIFRKTQDKFAEEAASTETITDREARRQAEGVQPEELLSKEGRNAFSERLLNSSDTPHIFNTLKRLGILSKTTQKIWEDARIQKDPNRDYGESFYLSAESDLNGWAKQGPSPGPESEKATLTTEKGKALKASEATAEDLLAEWDKQAAELGEKEAAEPAPEVYKIGDFVEPTTGSGLSNHYRGKITHIGTGGNGEQTLKIFGTKQHFSSSNFKLLSREGKEIKENPEPAEAKEEKDVFREGDLVRPKPGFAGAVGKITQVIPDVDVGREGKVKLISIDSRPLVRAANYELVPKEGQAKEAAPSAKFEEKPEVTFTKAKIIPTRAGVVAVPINEKKAEERPTVSPGVASITGKKLEEKPTPGEKARETVDHVKNAIDKFREINIILGEEGSIGGQLDQGKYDQIKPLLKAAWDEIVAAGKSAKEFVQLAIQTLSPKGKPYFEKFVREEVENATAAVTGRQGETAPANDQGRAGGEESSTVPATKEVGRAGELPGEQGAGNDVGLPGRVEPSRVSSRTREERKGQSDRTGEGDRRESSEPVGRDTGNVPGVLARGEDYVIQPGGLERKGGWKAAAKNNLDAIKLYKKILSENRPATKEEQEILVKYTGWGASELANNMFPGYAHYREIRADWAKEDWKALVERLKNLLNEEEIKTAARSTQYAHYTSEKVIRSIYKALTKFGFDGGKVLEPGAGIGHFIGLMPESLIPNTLYTGIEMDSISAGIAKLLYPHHNIIIGDYTKTPLPRDFFDAAIGNPPFGATAILADPEYRKQRFKLHNYFFAKSLDRVRPGGALVFVTSHYTMDAQSQKVREYLAKTADLVGAVRLPQTAFKQNAGTEVVTDVIFLKKRVKGEAPGGEPWLNLAEVDTPEGKTPINEYFARHPEMVLGRHSLQGSMYKKADYTVLPADEDIETLFDKAIERLPEGVYSKISAASETLKKKTFERDYNPKNKKEGGIYLSEKGELKIVDAGSGVDIEAVHENLNSKEKTWLKDYVPLRDAVKQNHFDQLTDGDWENSLKTLQNTYKKFVKKHGRISDYTISTRKTEDEDGNPVEVTYRRYKNEKLILMDTEGSLVRALEHITEDGEILESPALSERTIKKPEEPKIETPSDALAVSLNDRGRLDIPHIAELLNMEEVEVIESLGDLIFKDPSAGYIMSDEYLSGNVVRKLEEAQAAARVDKGYERNVEALKKVQPAPLAPKNITVIPGAPWIPIEYMNEFGEDVLGLRGCKVTHYPASNNWTVTGNFRPQGRRELGSEYGTADRGPNEIFDAALNNRVVKITRKDPDTGATWTDTAATTAANEKLKALKDRFASWVWQDGERARRLLEIYNRQMNNLAARRFDGSHLTLPGASTLIKLYEHQKRAIWRIIQTGNTYLAHSVGAGKTFVMIAAGMEMKRLGMISKPLYVVPKHMLGQFAREFNELYPTAHVMVADEQNFHTENRRRFVAQATLNNPDAIVVPHSSFGLFSLKPETIKPVRDDFISQLKYAWEEMRDADEPYYLIKQMEKRIEQAEQRFDSMIASGDKAVAFEEMGVDYVFVDEAHEFRKLDYITNQKIKGIDPKGSIKAMGLYIKTLWLESQNPGRSHTFASGTPITNTMGELYTVQRFFDPKGMEEEGLDHFDAWSTMFARAAVGYEMNAAGRYQPVERFSRFINIPELMNRVRRFMDVLTISQLATRVKLPAVKGGRPEIVISDPIPELKAYQDNVLHPRIQASMKWKPSKDEPGNPDPLINIITDGRLASIDMRFVSSSPNNPDSKLNKFIDGIIEVYKQTQNNEYFDIDGKTSPVKGGVQVCFYNHGFGEAVKTNRGIDARAWVMKRLKEAKIPAKDVAWIEDYDTAQKKEGLFKDLRSGKKRVLFGSAKQMGTGMNIQNRLSHLHYLDPPWYPADVEQPLGRIVRQGNQNEEVDIRWYATKGSYDATMWQLVSTKSKFIEKAFLGDEKLRTMEDVSEASQYEMASALASGDERIIRLVGLRAQVEKYFNLYREYENDKERFRWKINDTEWSLGNSEKRLAILQKMGKHVSGYVRFEQGEIDGKVYEKREEFNTALVDRIFKREGLDKAKEVLVGKVNGYSIYQTITSRKKTKNKETGEEKETFKTEVCLRFEKGLDERWSPDEVTAARLINFLNGIDSDIAQHERAIRDYKEELVDLNKRLTAPFEFEREYGEAIAEVARLERELAAEGEVLEAQALSQMTEDEANENRKKLVDNFLSELAVVASKDDKDRAGELSNLLHDAMTANYVEQAYEKAGEIFIDQKIEFSEEGEEKLESLKSAYLAKEAFLDYPTVIGEYPDYDRGVLESGQGASEQYSLVSRERARARTRLSPDVTVKDIQRIFKGQDVSITPQGEIKVVVGKDRSVIIRAVDKISPNRVGLEIGYAKGGLAEGEVIAGKYKDGEISLQRDISGRWTLTHESYHFMEDSGIVSREDVKILRAKIRSLEKVGKWTPQNQKDIGGAEDRAVWVTQQLEGMYDAKTLTGRILAKIRQFLDRVMEAFGIRRAEAVARDIESGRIFGEKGEAEDGIEGREPSTALHAITRIFDKRARLIRMNPVEIDSSEFGGEGKEEIRQKATEFYMNTLRNQTAVNIHDQRKFQFSRNGIDELRSHSGDIRGMRIVAGLKQVLENAIHLKSVAPKEQGRNIKAFHHYGALVDLDGVEIFIRVSVREDNNGNFFYDIPEIVEKEKSVASKKGEAAEAVSYPSQRSKERILHDLLNVKGEDTLKEQEWYAITQQPTGTQAANDIEQNRSFADTLFELRDVAKHNIQVQVAKLQKEVQRLAGAPSKKRVNLGFAWNKELKRSMASDQLDRAMMIYRDLQSRPHKADEFRTWANAKLAAADTPSSEKLKIKGQLKLLDQALNLTPEQRDFAMNTVGNFFEQAYGIAERARIVQTHRDNYVRRLWYLPEGKEEQFSGTGAGHGFKVTTTAAKQRTFDTILDGWKEGYELRMQGITNSFESYMTEIATILANKVFMQRGVATVDTNGNALFTTKKKAGYKQLQASGFQVWRWAGDAEAEAALPDQESLAINTYGRKFFATPPERLPEQWAVYESDTAPKAVRLFDDEDEAKNFADEKGFARIEHRPAKDVSQMFEQQPLYAPAPLADMINKMTGRDTLWNSTPLMKYLLRFNSGMKSWILMSSFFHHMALSRSWVFAVHTGFKKLNPVTAYKRGYQKIMDLHPLIELGVKNGLTLGEMQEWSEHDLRQSAGMTERLMKHFGLETPSKVVDYFKFKRESWADSLFKKFQAGMKAEAFVIEYTHELQKATDRFNAGKTQEPPDVDLIAERVARLLNEDFGGLHLERMGRNPTLQKVIRFFLLAPDWTESNIRPMTGLIPGFNEAVDRLLGGIPQPKGMEPIYWSYTARSMIRIMLATLIAQLLLNGKDETEEFLNEQMFSNRWNKFRWTEVDITKLYDMMGIDTEGTRKTFSPGGHFWDPLKLIDPWTMIKHKGSPIVRTFDAVFTGSDWAERPFTGTGELLKTGKTVKKSFHQRKEGEISRLPATLVNQVVNMQPIQVGQFIRYFQGEDDGLTALFRSAGGMVHTAYPPYVDTAIISSGSKGEKVLKEIERLKDAGFTSLGPPSRSVTLKGLPEKMSLAQYQEFVKKSSALAEPKLIALVEGEGWAKMRPDRQADVVEKIITNARRRARVGVKKEIGRDTTKTIQSVGLDAWRGMNQEQKLEAKREMKKAQSIEG